MQFDTAPLADRWSKFGSRKKHRAFRTTTAQDTRNSSSRRRNWLRASKGALAIEPLARDSEKCRNIKTPQKTQRLTPRAIANASTKSLKTSRA